MSRLRRRNNEKHHVTFPSHPFFFFFFFAVCMKKEGNKARRKRYLFARYSFDAGPFLHMIKLERVDLEEILWTVSGQNEGVFYNLSTRGKW